MHRLQKIVNFLALKKQDISVCIFILVINLFAHLPELLNKYCVYPDLIYAFPYFRYSDYSLFSGDIVSRYILFHAALMKYNAVLFHNIFIFLARITDLFIFPKAISLLCGIASGFIVYVNSKKKWGSDFAFYLAVIFLVYSLCTDAFWGGLERGFGYMATTIFFFSLIQRNYFGMLISIAIALTSYLVACPGMLLASFVLVMFDLKKINRQTVLFIIGLACAGAYLFVPVASSSNFATTFNHSVDYKYIYAPPLIKTKYLYGGEGYFFNNTFSFIEYFLNCFLNLNEHLTSLYTFLTFLFMIFGSFVILFFKDFRKNLEKEVWIFFISYIVVFFAVSAFYSPLIASRTVVSAIPILLVFLFAKAIYYISKLISRALIFGVSLLIALSFIIFCPHNNIRDYASYKPLFDYVEKLPKNALLAGTIRTLEPVPFFSHRPVFYMTVYSTMPTNGDFYNEVEKRKRQLLEALYGDSLEAIKSLVKSYGITHMVIEKKYFGSDFLNNLRDPTVHGLYIGLIKEIINKNKKRSFPVLGLTEISDFNYRDIVVVDAKKILNYIEK